MNFLKSVFADGKEESESREEEKEGDGWSMGGLMKSITTKSESVIETYRRDLQEFGWGVRKEIQEAQGSVSHKLEELRASVMRSEGVEQTKGRRVGPTKYSRFDAQLRGLQGDDATYCTEPEDVEDFTNWRRDFAVTQNREDIDGLLAHNGFVSDFFKKLVLVPGSGLDEETFWCRYFYRVSKLEQAEALRVSLVERAISKDDDEDLSWDVDDDDHDDHDDGHGHDDDDGHDDALPPTTTAEQEEWDEIEDLSSIDDKKAVGVSTQNKRLGVAQIEEEDLSWDFEDDEDVKA